MRNTHAILLVAVIGSGIVLAAVYAIQPAAIQSSTEVAEAKPPERATVHTPQQHETGLVPIDDKSRSLNDRARSFLAFNCADCHRSGGTGPSSFVFDQAIPLPQMKLVGQPTQHGYFGIENAKLIVRGDPTRSVLLYRLMKTSHGRSLPCDSGLIDGRDVQLLYDWIKSLETPPQEVLDREQICKGVLKYPDVASINFQLESVSTAMTLAVAMIRNEVTPWARDKIAKVAAEHEDAEIRDLFQRFLPASPN